jgi:hypothetical protein
LDTDPNYKLNRAMPVEIITSLQNPRLKRLIRLRDRRPRDEERAFLVEGYREVRRALEKKVTLGELYFSREWFLGVNEPALLAEAEASGAMIYELSKEAFAKVAYRERPDGILAVAPQWRRKLSDLTMSAKPFILVVEAIEKPGNLGTILRSADAAGCDAVIVCDPVRRGGKRDGAFMASGERDQDRGHDPRRKGALFGDGPAGSARHHHGKRAIRAERVLAQECRCARAHSDGRTGGLPKCGDGRVDHAF